MERSGTFRLLLIVPGRDEGRVVAEEPQPAAGERGIGHREAYASGYTRDLRTEGQTYLLHLYKPMGSSKSWTRT